MNRLIFIVGVVLLIIGFLVPIGFAIPNSIIALIGGFMIGCGLRTSDDRWE